jgi:MFS family permease
MWLPGPLFGRLVDTYGPGPVLYPSAVLCIFGLCMTSLSNQYYQIFLAQGLVFGIGAGGTFTAAFICVGQWFSKRRGLATGIASSGSSVGGVIFPIFLNRLTESIGLDGALRYTALLIGVLLTISCFMITARLPRKKWDSNFKWFHASLFAQAPFSLYSIGAFLTWWGLWGPFDFISSMAQSVGMSADLALYLISIIK